MGWRRHRPGSRVRAVAWRLAAHAKSASRVTSQLISFRYIPSSVPFADAALLPRGNRPLSKGSVAFPKGGDVPGCAKIGIGRGKLKFQGARPRGGLHFLLTPDGNDEAFLRAGYFNMSQGHVLQSGLANGFATGETSRTWRSGQSS